MLTYPLYTGKGVGTSSWSPPSLSPGLAIAGTAFHSRGWTSKGPIRPRAVQVLNLLPGNSAQRGSGLLVIYCMNTNLAFGESFRGLKGKTTQEGTKYYFAYYKN